MSSNPLFNFLASLPYICVLFNKRNVNKIPTHSGKLTANRSQLIYWENTFFCTIFRVFISSPGRKKSTLALHAPSVAASPARRIHVRSGSGITSTSVRVPLEFHAN